MPPRKSAASSVGAAADISNMEGDSTLSMATTDATPSNPKGTAKGSADDGIGVEDLLLPRTLTQRLARGVLPPNTSIHRDALLALSKAATVFVSYLSSHASEALPPNKRTIGPREVFEAVKEVEFGPLMLGRLEGELARFEEVNRNKRKGYRDRIKGQTAGKDGGESGVEGPEGGEGGAERDTKRVKREGGNEYVGGPSAGAAPWAAGVPEDGVGGRELKPFSAFPAADLQPQQPPPFPVNGQLNSPHPFPPHTVAGTSTAAVYTHNANDDTQPEDEDEEVDEEEEEVDDDPGEDEEEDPEEEEDDEESEAEAQLRQEMLLEEREGERSAGDDGDRDGTEGEESD